MHVRDKISSYDTHNDTGMYNTNAKPPSNANQIHLSKDTLESELLKRQASDRLNKAFVDSSVAYSIMKVTKYIFVIVAWPPYALFIELPKWMLNQMIPIFAGFAKGAAKKTKKWTEMIAGQLAPVVSFMKDLVNTIGIPLVYISQRIYQYARTIGKHTLNAIRTMRSYGAIMSAVSNFADKTAKNIKKVISNTAEIIKDPFVKLASKIKSLTSEAVQMLASTEIMQKFTQIPQVILGWLALPMLQPLTSRFDRAQGIAENVTAKMAAFMALFVKKPLSVISGVFNSAFAHIGEFLGSYINRGFDFLKEKGQKYVDWAKDKSKKLNPFRLLIRFFSSSFFAWVPEFIRKAIAKAFQWFANLSPFVNLRKGFSKAWNAFLEMPLTLINWFIKGMEQVWKAITNSFTFVGKSCMSLVNYIEHAAYRIVYWSLTTVFMSGLIMTWGMLLLGRVSGKVRSLIRT